MIFSLSWIRISLFLLALCGVFFFFNRKPKFIVPVAYLRYQYWRVYNILLGIILCSVVLLPLRISFVSDTHVVTEKNLPIQIVLDVSLSMAANDIQPSRFDAAKHSLISLVQQLDGYYISLITFSWKPFVFVPFSSSSSAIVQKLHAMNLGDFPPVPEFLWTAIGDALLLGVNNLQQFVDQETYKPWIVILITDGDSNIGFDPAQVIKYYQKVHVPIFVLGVWQADFVVGLDTWNDKVTTTINLWLLQQLADKTWGKFSRVLGKQSFDEFFSELLETIETQQQQKIQNTFWELNTYLIYLLIIVLFWLLAFRLYLLFHWQKKL